MSDADTQAEIVHEATHWQDAAPNLTQVASYGYDIDGYLRNVVAVDPDLLTSVESATVKLAVAQALSTCAAAGDAASMAVAGEHLVEVLGQLGAHMSAQGQNLGYIDDQVARLASETGWLRRLP